MRVLSSIGRASFREVLRKALLASLAASTLLTTGCEKDGTVKQRQPEDSSVSVLQKDSAGSVLQVDPAVQVRLGLRMAPAEQVTLSRTIEGYARVLDPTSLVELAATEKTTRAADYAATQEFARLRQLAKSQNISVRALESAQASQTGSEAEWRVAKAKLSIAWGAVLLQRADFDLLLDELSTGHKALVRVDLPAGEQAQPTAIELTLIDNPTSFVTAVLIGSAPSASERFQGPAFLAVVEASLPRLVPGTFLLARLELVGPPVTGFRVPRAAVVRESAKTWAYVQAGSGKFARREVQLVQATATDWVVTGGITSGDDVVATGAQSLLSFEGRATAAPGD